MSLKQKVRVLCPSKYAYAEQGFNHGQVKPNEDLYFEFELMTIGEKEIFAEHKIDL